MTDQLEATSPTGSPVPDPPAESTEAPRWRPILRFAFRFAVAYLALIALTEVRLVFPLLGLVGLVLPADALATQYHLVEPLVRAAGDLIGVDARLIEPIESGDQPFFWVLGGLWVLGALLAAAVWSYLDRQRPNYATGYAWLLRVARFTLAAQLLAFGFAKVFPVQMSLPLSRLVEPYGDFSPMNVLWMQVGASPAYEVLLGCAEVVAGLLLLFPRTALLGAALAVVDLTQVLLLDVTYQVPLLIFTFQLLLLSLLLLLPHARRLWAFFLTDRGVPPMPPRARARRKIRIWVGVLIVWLVASQLVRGAATWIVIGAPADRPPLYGIWNVAEFSLDGQVRPPLTTDGERWYRFIVDLPHSYQLDTASSQRMDGSIVDYQPKVDERQHVLELTQGPEKVPVARFSYAQPDADRLVLDGDLGGHRVLIRLDRVDPDTFPIRDRGPKWVQDGPVQPRLDRD
jgi:hypothetical protein